MKIVSNENKAEFKEMLEYLKSVAELFKITKNLKLFKEEAVFFYKFDFLTKADEVYENTYNIIAPRVAQISNFNADNINLLELPIGERINNLAKVRSELSPALEQLEKVVKTYASTRLMKKVLKSGVVVKPAKGFKKAQKKLPEAEQIKVCHFKPEEPLTLPSQKTAAELLKLSKLYSEILVKSGIVTVSKNSKPSNPLVKDIERYVQTKVLKVKEEEKIAKKTTALIDVLENFNKQENIMDSMEALDKVKKQIESLKRKVREQHKIGEEGEKFAVENNITPLTPTKPVKR